MGEDPEMKGAIKRKAGIMGVMVWGGKVEPGTIIFVGTVRLKSSFGNCLVGTLGRWQSEPWRAVATLWRFF